MYLTSGWDLFKAPKRCRVETKLWQQQRCSGPDLQRIFCNKTGKRSFDLPKAGQLGMYCVKQVEQDVLAIPYINLSHAVLKSSKQSKSL